ARCGEHSRRRRTSRRPGGVVPLRPGRHRRLPPARCRGDRLRRYRAHRAVAHPAARGRRRMGARSAGMSATATSLTGAMLQWLNDHAAEGIFTTDMDLRIRSWNEWLHTARGLVASSAIGRDLFEVIPSLKERGFDAYYREALAGEVKVLSHKLHRFVVPSMRSGEQIPQSGRIAPLLEDGVVVAPITFIADVSERVVAEHELRAQIATAERARHVA